MWHRIVREKSGGEKWRRWRHGSVAAAKAAWRQNGKLKKRQRHENEAARIQSGMGVRNNIFWRKAAKEKRWRRKKIVIFGNICRKENRRRNQCHNLISKRRKEEMKHNRSVSKWRREICAALLFLRCGEEKAA
jgi:hypothetical protein